MAERLIIENRTDMPMSEVIRYANTVILKGRISDYGKQYCYLTVFDDSTYGKIFVSASKNKNSDRLVIHYNDGEDHAG